MSTTILVKSGTFKTRVAITWFQGSSLPSLRIGPKAILFVDTALLLSRQYRLQIHLY